MLTHIMGFRKKKAAEKTFKSIFFFIKGGYFKECNDKMSLRYLLCFLQNSMCVYL